MKDALYQFLKTYRNIPPDDFEIIAQHLNARVVEADEILLNQNSVAKELYFIVDGILKIITTNDKGNEVVQFFVRENRFCTILYSFNNGTPATESIVAAIKTDLLFFSKADLQRLYEKLPYLEDLIESITSQALLDKIKIRNSYMGEEASTRYLKFMAQQPDVMRRVPLSDVASYLGITQQSLSRIRRNLTKDDGTK
jgi:CRP-like cAMP-binding protein